MTTVAPRRRSHESSEAWKAFGREDPTLHTAYEALADAAWQGGGLSAVTKQLLLVAAVGTASEPDRNALQAQVRNALEAGASRAQVREVLAVASILGVHSCIIGTPILLDEMVKLGLAKPDATRPETVQIREEFMDRRGYWSDLWEAVAAFDPQFLRAYLDYSSIPGERAVLDAQVRELVLIVLSSVTTHLFPDGLRVHVRGALSVGVPPDHIMQTFELLAAHGVRSVVDGYGLAELTQPHHSPPVSDSQS